MAGGQTLMFISDTFDGILQRGGTYEADRAVGETQNSQLYTV